MANEHSYPTTHVAAYPLFFSVAQALIFCLYLLDFSSKFYKNSSTARESPSAGVMKISAWKTQ